MKSGNKFEKREFKVDWKFDEFISGKYPGEWVSLLQGEVLYLCHNQAYIFYPEQNQYMRIKSPPSLIVSGKLYQSNDYVYLVGGFEVNPNTEEKIKSK